MRPRRDVPNSFRDHLTEASRKETSNLTARSLIIGLLLAASIGPIGPYITLYMQGSNPGGLYYINPLAHVLFLILVAGLNVAVASLRPTWALQRGELLTVYILTILANSTFSLISYFVPMLSGAFYYATPENDFHLLHPYIPTWIMPHGTKGITEMYEGIGNAEIGDLWKVWITPLLSWLPLLVAIEGATLSLMVVLRRQWSEYEHLPYPLIQLPLAMTEPGDNRSVVPSFFRAIPMWVGFSLPAVVLSFQGLRAYYPELPALSFSQSIPFFGGEHIILFLHFGAIGFFYLVNREIAFSLWVFSILNTIQVGIFNLAGWGENMPAVSVWTYTRHSIAHQSVGAMIVLVLGGLWMAREHLVNVVRRAFGDEDVDDSDEIMSYRSALLCFVGSVIVITVWLYMAGIPVFAIAVFLFLVFVIFVALTRLCAEGGVATLFPPMVPPDVTVSMLGSTVVGAGGLLGLLFTRVWANDVLNFTMPHCANSLKLSERLGRKRGWLFAAMLAAILLGVTTGTYALLKLTYTYGGLNLSRHFTWLPKAICEYVVRLMTTPVAPDLSAWFNTGLGGLVMAVLMTARWHLPWWPLHPLGFPVSSVFARLMVNAFIAWGAQSLVKRFGGQRAHLTARLFFMGIILGHMSMYGIFWIIDAFTGVTGNRLM